MLRVLLIAILLHPQSVQCTNEQENTGTCESKYSNNAKMTYGERLSILTYHNNYRDTVALGKQDKQPFGANIRRLEWNDNLAMMAQTRASKCQKDVTRSKCKTLPSQKVGVNVGKVICNENRTVVIENIVTKFFHEIAHYSYSEKYWYDPKTERYTQLIWAETYLIGCGQIGWKNSKDIHYVALVCYYYPKGNILSGRIYIKGLPATSCPSNTIPSFLYPGLCETIQNETMWTDRKVEIDYCTEKCIDPGYTSHTMCLRKGCPIDPPCKRNLVGNSTITTEEMRTLLAWHNKRRSDVAMGGGVTSQTVANIQRLRWNAGLAEMAQCWVNSCLMQHDIGCRDFDDMSIGQNFGMRGPYRNSTLVTILDDFYDEYKHYNFSTEFNPINFMDVGHYTQLVWASTYMLGCGKIVYYSKENRVQLMHLVCNYGPTGNIIDGLIYQTGEPASACPNGTVPSLSYAGLCEFPPDTTTMIPLLYDNKTEKETKKLNLKRKQLTEKVNSKKRTRTWSTSQPVEVEKKRKKLKINEASAMATENEPQDTPSHKKSATTRLSTIWIYDFQMCQVVNIRSWIFIMYVIYIF